MPKELIVSVNGREKKIAIVEDGRVTEFYIERGEGGQGIVGNIYKGRVMRVLPGMQSAFVDIGLERDAFLYVSDFFDEEEEFERIVVDKSKAEGADAATAARAAAEKIERGRLERERMMETAQERAEPIMSEGATDELEHVAPLIKDGELGEATTLATGAVEVEEAEVGGRRHRRSRSKRGKGGTGERTPETAAAAAASSGKPPTSFVQEVQSRLAAKEGGSTPFVTADPSFMRVVDEDEAAAVEGEMFKDARLQERFFDQIHAVEFDMETTTEAEVGSVLAQSQSSDSSFQRIADDDLPYDEAHRTNGSVQEAVAASVAHFTDDLLSETTTSSPQAFERVSDDEKAVEALPGSSGAASSSSANRIEGGRGSSSRRGAKSKATEGAADKEESAASKKKRASGKGITKTASKKSPKDSKAAASKGRSRNKTKADSEESLTDADASITSRPARGEFARRGGRRRRRNEKPAGTNGAPDDRSNGHAEEVEAIAEVEAVSTPEPQPERASAGGSSGSGGGGGRSQTRGERGRSEHGRAEGNRGGRDSGRDNRSEGGRSSSGGGGGGGRERRDRSTPMITDLLREGQEILVQIAKEPIAQKGARITSHIALPGRFLVYMPTIEHVGVSRKIESDGERVRLRKLIQAIRAEEDVPSGGFIVRTAGVGISEEDLRNDARYLVRTWKDIRRSAEKPKAPALVHADLDLVQRLLRDQLSDDFSAIRVDSEEEYLQIVEFVNRIQPRLVKRVKLYTREQPILEAFGVQAEIEKAIKPRVWLRSGGYLVINQTEALVAIDVNTGKFVGRGGSRLEDTITRTNMEAVEEIARQIRLRDLGGIIVLDLIDMEDRRNRNRVMAALQDALKDDKSPTKVLSFNDFGLVIMTRKRVKQSLERTLCAPCPYCTGAGLVKSPQTVCYEILEEARRLSRGLDEERLAQATLRINPEVSRALRSTERDVLKEIEDYLGAVDITADEHVHQEQFDFAFV